jgi:hypothetical protein
MTSRKKSPEQQIPLEKKKVFNEFEKDVAREANEFVIELTGTHSPFSQSKSKEKKREKSFPPFPPSKIN